jgi:hypothetical protein
MKQGTKRLLSLVIALVFLAVAFVLFFDLVEPAYSDVQTLRGQAVGEATSLASEQTLVTQIKNLLTSYTTQSGNETSLGLAMPTGQNISGALTELEGIAQNNNIAINNILVSPPSLLAQSAANAGNASGTAAGLVKPLGSFTLQLTAQGSYENFQNFISQIETNIRLFDIQSVSLTPVSSAGGTKVVTADNFNYSVSIETYYQLP